MRLRAGLAGGLAVLLSVSCSRKGGEEKEAPILPVLTVMKADVRMGLTADDGEVGDPVIAGTGFEKVSPSSYVSLMIGGKGRGTLNDGNNAVAKGLAQSSTDLQASVVVKPGPGGAKSSAQTVQLSTTALHSEGAVSEVRVETETFVEGTLSGGAVAICEVRGEALLDGHSMSKISTKLYLYPDGENIVVYRGPRSATKAPLGAMENGGSFTSQDPSFYFKLGPGVYQLTYTLKLSAACPPGEAGSSAALKATGTVGLR